MTQFLASNNLVFHCAIEGLPNGFPLVFINSLGTDLRIWDAVASKFAARYRLIRYDKRGHGLSDCPPAPYTIRDHTKDLAGLLDHLKINQAILIGISVGGMIAMDFAAAWPQRIQKLVLSDTATKIGTQETWNERINALRQHGMDYLGEAILARWFAPSFAAESPASYRGFKNMLTRTPVEGYTGTCEAIRDADLTESAPSIQAPTLVLCGKEDLATPPDTVRNLIELLPDASFEEIAGAAHLPCIEQPQAMVDLIDGFL